MDRPSFGDLLQRYRRAAGLTQEELAERAGLSARGISDLERGLRTCPGATPSSQPFRPGQVVKGANDDQER